MDLIDIFRAFHPNAAEYANFSSAHGMFSRVGHMLGQNTSLSIFKNIEIILHILFDHNVIKLEINHEKNSERHTKTWKLNNISGQP